jgi:hypothetical protein
MKMSLSRYLFAVLLAGLGFLGGAAYAQPAARDGYIGVVSKSDSRKVGQQFTFANLRSSQPFVTYPSGNGDKSTKVFEDDELIVLIFVAHLTGSTETFYLSKKRGNFTLIEVGALEATASGSDFRPKVTYGTLR